MKEHTYGWYPPAKDVWTHYRAKQNTYEAECRYKHSRSRFTDQPGVPTPVPPTHIQLDISSPRSRPPTTPRRIRPTPRKAWTSYVPQTPTLMGPSMSQAYTPEGTTQQQQRRVQSAHSHRPRTTTKPRPVKSAGPTRSPTTQSANLGRESGAPARLTKSVSAGEIQELQSGVENSLIRGCPTPERPHTTTPELHTDWEDEYRHPPTPEPLYTEAPTHYAEAPTHYSAPPTRQWTVYDNQLKEHGWRMEVPGDPLNLKRPCITKRLSYTTKIPIASVQPEGPRSHMVNYDTYFYNTIPRRRATFDVAKDWASEVLHAKRMELQKRDGGIKYKYKNFSFVY